MLVEIIAGFLALSLVLYCLFAGADFGGGILEVFMSRKDQRAQRDLISHAMGPVWEANHVWLILAVVILFSGFPGAYGSISVSFHIPLTIMLLGIVLRGCAFTFRHYDAVKGRSQDYYSLVFMISSLLTPFAMGAIAGGMILGKVAEPSEGFYAAFVAPWFNLFSFSLGAFTCVLFAFLASVYLIGESQDVAVRALFIARVKWTNLLAMVTGALVFIAAEFANLKLLRDFTAGPILLAMMAAVTLLLIPLWMSIHRRRDHWARVIVAAQVGLIVIGWFRLQFPVFITSENGPVSIYTAAAPEATLRVLLWALIVGSCLIFPALIYLLMIFKRSDRSH